MKIEELLKDYPDDYDLKVGAKNGAGYFYCGTVGDFKANIDKISDVIRNHLEQKYKNHSRTVEYDINNFISTAQAYDYVDISDRISAFEPMILQIAKHINTKRNANERLRKFVPIKERDVADSFISMLEDNCLAVTIDGTESGKFWGGFEADGSLVGISAVAEHFVVGDVTDI